ncbi:HmuY protein [Capnocytophaga haemolytica]|uniref:HmuY protein n=1 Tax=Capnocytophaga haemolytica TaxID=45243 RepID=A0AAX2GYP3_9FLAO|nr:HmuY family protein [Capnocytophaga haemolytica]AMD84254.1 hypothetical protein AXF12_01100 [Capnocytophaga haemolytica]SFN95859.1 HmuY protein [Capnocytophaga haemolytica]SNV12287.1 Uncharacterised protein [Capnocytophaga haemolytica]
MRRIFIAVMAIGAMVVLSGCSKDDSPEQSTAGIQVKNLDAASNDEQIWTYFSFATGKLVSPTGAVEESKEWDIAFHRFYIKTNSGTSGKGNVGVAATGVKDFDAVTKAPTQGYEADKMVTVETRPATPDTAPSNVIVSSNPVITGTVESKDPKGWYNYVRPQQGETTPHFNITKYVYAIRTLEGKYVKIQLTDYTNDYGTSGYISFRYAFIEP